MKYHNWIDALVRRIIAPLIWPILAGISIILSSCTPALAQRELAAVNWPSNAAPLPTPTLAPLPQSETVERQDTASTDAASTGAFSVPLEELDDTVNDKDTAHSAESRQPTPTPTPTRMPVLQIAARAQATATLPAPTATPLPTAESRPATVPRDPIVQPDLPVSVRVIDLQTSEPVPGAAVTLTGTSTRYQGTQITNGDGLAQFSQVPFGDNAFTVVAKGVFHGAREQDVRIASEQAAVTVALWPFVTATITEDRVNMRDLPHLDSKVIGSLDKGDKLIVRGISPDNVWLFLETTRGDEAWVSGTYAQVEGDLTTVPILDVPWPFGDDGQDDA